MWWAAHARTMEPPSKLASPADTSTDTTLYAYAALVLTHTSVSMSARCVKTSAAYADLNTGTAMINIVGVASSASTSCRAVKCGHTSASMDAAADGTEGSTNAKTNAMSPNTTLVQNRTAVAAAPVSEPALVGAVSSCAASSPASRSAWISARAPTSAGS